MIDEAPDVLEDDDILEMVNAGLAPITVVDDYLAEFWSQVFTRHQRAPRRQRCAPAATWPSPFARTIPGSERWSTSGSGSTERATPSETCSNAGISRTSSTCKNAAADAERQKLQAVVELFKKYGGQYDLDYLLMAAQGYQESTLDQSVKSPVGAIGVMQVMPPTGKELNVGDISRSSRTSTPA